MTKTRAAIAVTVAAAAIFGLAGCAEYSKADALQTPHSVIELKNAGFATPSEFGYVDSEGQVKELPVCGRPSFFEKRYCDSADGIYHFQYSTSKGGGVISASLTIDGERIELDCNTDTDDRWSSLSICLPEGTTIPEE